MGEQLVIGMVLSCYHVIVVGVVEKYKMDGPRWYFMSEGREPAGHRGLARQV